MNILLDTNIIIPLEDTSRILDSSFAELRKLSAEQQHCLYIHPIQFEDIKRDKAKVAKLQEQIKVKEAKLKEAEASQIVADVGAMNLTPEQLGEFLALIQSGNLNELLSGKTKIVTTVSSSEVNEEENEDLYEDEEDENNED